jgi:hypothetical protein
MYPEFAIRWLFSSTKAMGMPMTLSQTLYSGLTLGMRWIIPFASNVALPSKIRGSKERPPSFRLW